MATVLQVCDRTITSEEIIPLVASYQLVPQLLRENIIDQAIANFTCTPEQTTAACQEFYQRCNLTSEVEQQAWLERYGMKSSHLEALTTRKLRIEKFKQATWGRNLESYFLKRKMHLEQAIYSLIRTQHLEIAQELYFRIQAKEQSFAELAQKYSQGPEAQTGGIRGPVELGTLHPTLARLLCISQPSQLWHPTRVGEWLVIVRLEKLIPAQLNEWMRQRLLNELFEAWLQEQFNQLPDSDKVWLDAINHKTKVVNYPVAA